MPSIVDNLSGQEFYTEKRLRVAHAGLSIMKLMVVATVMFIAVNIAFNSRVPFGIEFIGILLIVSVLLYRGRVAWGTGIRFNSSGIELLRKGAKSFVIPSRDIREIKVSANSVSVRFNTNGRPGFRVIGNEGFPRPTWRALTEYVRTRFPTERRPH